MLQKYSKEFFFTIIPPPTSYEAEASRKSKVQNQLPPQI